MKYLCLIIMIVSNALETISYYTTKVKSTFGILFGVSLWSTIFGVVFSLIFFFLDPQIVVGINVLNLSLIFVMAIINIWLIVVWVLVTTKVSMSIAEGVSNIYIALLTVCSYFVFGGVLRWWDILLMCIVVIVCIMLAFTKQNNTTSKTSGLVYLAIWVLLACIKGLIPGEISSSNLNGAIFSLALNLFILVPSIIIIVMRHEFKTVVPQALQDKYLMINGLMRVLSQMAIIYLANVMNLGLIDAIAVLGLIIVMAYERYVMKQKVDKKVYPLLIIIMISTILLSIL